MTNDTPPPADAQIWVAACCTLSDGDVRRGEVLSHNTSSAQVQWEGARIERVSLKDKTVTFYRADGTTNRPTAQLQTAAGLISLPLGHPGAFCTRGQAEENYQAVTEHGTRLKCILLKKEKVPRMRRDPAYPPAASTRRRKAAAVTPPAVVAAPLPAPVEPVEQPDLEACIRAAYTVLATYPGAWVGLARIRDELMNMQARKGMAFPFPASEVDAALNRMMDADDVNLVPESNQKSLTDRDQKAAVWIGGQWKHLMSIFQGAPVVPPKQHNVRISRDDVAEYVLADCETCGQEGHVYYVGRDAATAAYEQAQRDAAAHRRDPDSNPLTHRPADDGTNLFDQQCQGAIDRFRAGAEKGDVSHLSDDELRMARGLMDRQDRRKPTQATRDELDLISHELAQRELNAHPAVKAHEEAAAAAAPARQQRLNEFNGLDNGLDWSTNSGVGALGNARQQYEAGEPPWDIADRLYDQAAKLERRGEAGHLSDHDMTGPLRHDQTTRDRAAGHDAARLRAVADKLEELAGPAPSYEDRIEARRASLRERIRMQQLAANNPRHARGRDQRLEWVKELQDELDSLGPSSKADVFAARFKTLPAVDASKASIETDMATMNGAELRAACAKLDIPVGSRDSKPAMREAIRRRIQHRIDTDSIMRAGTGTLLSPTQVNQYRAEQIDNLLDTANNLRKAGDRAGAAQFEALAGRYQRGEIMGGQASDEARVLRRETNERAAAAAAAPVAGVAAPWNPADVVAQLRALASTAAGTKLLAEDLRLTKAQLQIIAGQLGLKGMGGLSNAKLIYEIIWMTIQSPRTLQRAMGELKSGELKTPGWMKTPEQP